MLTRLAAAGVALGAALAAAGCGSSSAGDAARAEAVRSDVIFQLQVDGAESGEVTGGYVGSELKNNYFYNAQRNWQGVAPVALAQAVAALRDVGVVFNDVLCGPALTVLRGRRADAGPDATSLVAVRYQSASQELRLDLSDRTQSGIPKLDVRGDCPDELLDAAGIQR